MNIAKKLLIIVFLIVSFGLFSLGLLSYMTYLNASKNDLEANTSISLEKTALSIQKQINEIDILTEKAQFYSKSNYNLMDDLTKYTSRNYTNEDLFFSNEEITGIFRTLIYRMDYVNFVALILPNDHSFSYTNSQKDFTYGYNPRNEVWYKNTINATGDLLISVIDVDNAIVNGGDSRELTFSRAIYDFYSKELLGVLVVNCEPSIFNFISSDFPDKVIGFELIDDISKQTIYSDLPATSKKNTEIINKKINFTNQDLALNVLLDYSDYQSLLFITFRTIIIIISIILLISLFIIFLFSKNFTAPIVLLSQLMKKRADDNEKINNFPQYEERSDEIGTLYYEYNHMLHALEQHTIEKINYEQSILKSELNVYKNQIDSHFLYNTLESVNSLAEIIENEDIATMTVSLSRMFRYASNGFLNEATIKEELENVNDYLKIQRIRFQKPINFLYIFEDKELSNCLIPKILLQPLIENAIFHGLDRGNTPGQIRLFVKQKEDGLLLRIYDNGCGIPPETLLTIQNEIKNAQQLVRVKNLHISLINIEARIKHSYDEHFGLSIYSQENTGTLIEIFLPLIWEEKK